MYLSEMKKITDWRVGLIMDEYNCTTCGNTGEVWYFKNSYDDNGDMVINDRLSDCPQCQQFRKLRSAVTPGMPVQEAINLAVEDTVQKDKNDKS